MLCNQASTDCWVGSKDQWGPTGPWSTIEHRYNSAPYQPKIETYPQSYKIQSLNY